MSAIELHLFVNHVPVIGVWIGAALLAWGLLVRKEQVRRTALGLVALLAIAIGPAYYSGTLAEDGAEELPGVASADVHEHEEAAEFALVACAGLGVIALGVLLWFRRAPAIPTPWLAGVLLLALACAVILARTAHSGGEIRHPEIRGGTGAAARLG